MTKKILALLLILVLAAAPALADGVIMRQLHQGTYINTLLLTPETYPEMMLTNVDVWNIMGTYNQEEAKFVCFTGPDDALVETFDNNYALYIDADRAIQYSYQVRSSDSWEEFFAGAASEDQIVLEEEGVMGAYIEPDQHRAYGMLPLSEYGRTAKLRITISMDRLDTKNVAGSTQALTDAIVAEVKRVSGAMRYETFDMFWSAGRYSGIKLLDYNDYAVQVNVTFPEMQIYTTEGKLVPGTPVVTQMRNNELGLYYYEAGCDPFEITIGLSNYSYAANMLEDGDADTSKMTLPNGHEWIVNMYDFSEESKSYMIRASYPVPSTNDRQLYLSIAFELNYDHPITSTDEMIELLSKFDALIEIVDANSDPYVPSEAPAVAPVEEPAAPAEAPAEEPAEAPAEADSWTCPDCGTVSTGKFCPECGASRPAVEETAEWTCPECGTVSTGKFCPECGAKKPE